MLYDSGYNGRTETVVDRYLELSRAYALIGLLRIVDDSVPLDLAYIYGANTSCELKYYIEDMSNLRHNSDKTNPYKMFNEGHDQIIEIPTSIRKMVKEYLIRRFWKQLKHISCYSWDLTDRVYNNGNGYASSRSRSELIQYTLLFPKHVCNAVASMFVPDRGELTDMHNSINVLYATIFNPNNSKQYMSQPGTGTLGAAGIQKMRKLADMVYNYIRSKENRGEMPTVIEKKILLDTLEIMLTMFGEWNFFDGLNARNVYEFKKASVDRYMAEKRNGGTGSERRYGCCCDSIRSYDVGRYGMISQISIETKFLTPNAALCVGNMFNPFRPCYCESSFLRDIGQKINPRPPIEVSLFMEEELRVQTAKDRYQKRKFPNSNINPDLVAKDNDSDQCEECIGVPCR